MCDFLVAGSKIPVVAGKLCCCGVLLVSLAACGTSAKPGPAPGQRTNANEVSGKKSGKRASRVQSLAQNYRVVLRVSSPLITAGPGLVKFSNGALLAVCPVDGYRKGGEKAGNSNYRVHLVLSRDGGVTWQEPSAPLPYMTATPFLIEDVVYLLAHRRGRRDVVIVKSDDQGATWSEPVELYRGPYWNAPTGIAVRDGVLYRALGTGGHGARIETVVLALDLKQNPMSPQSWRKSNPVRYPGTPKELDRNLYPGGSGRSVFAVDHWLEPNISNVRGRLLVTHRTRIDGYATAGLTAICELRDSGDEMKLQFTQFYPKFRVPTGRVLVVRGYVHRGPEQV